MIVLHGKELPFHCITRDGREAFITHADAKGYVGEIGRHKYTWDYHGRGRGGVTHIDIIKPYEATHEQERIEQLEAENKRLRNELSRIRNAVKAALEDQDK